MAVALGALVLSGVLNGCGSAGTAANAGGQGGTAGAAAQPSGAAGTGGQPISASGAGGSSSEPPTAQTCGPGCFPLCEGGDCSCECSPTAGCESQGWQPATVSWANFGIVGLTSPGVELCLPEGWMPTQAEGHSFTDGERSLRVYVEVRLDHADALQRVSENDVAYCTYEDYVASFVRARPVAGEDWPALIQVFTEVPPVCGECPGPLPTEMNTTTQVHIAFGHYLITTLSSVPKSLAQEAEVIEIGRTARVQTSDSPAQPGNEIADLLAQHIEQCPQ